MPAPASEDDLKRRARRRLIGAVALTLVAVIALPLLVEDEPPPAGGLEVTMPPSATIAQPVNPSPVVTSPVVPAPEPPAVQPSSEAKATAPETPLPKPKPKMADGPEAKLKIPTKSVPPAPSRNDETTPLPERTSGSFVVQLGAFSDPTKVDALKARAAELGLPSYTDHAGALTRLRAGPFPSRDAARAAADELAGAGINGQVMPK